MEEGEQRDIVGSLAKGLAVMEILAAHRPGLTLSEVAEKAGLTRAGARRLLLTLASSGYATQDGRRFILSPRLISLARNWVSGASLWSFAEPIMREISDRLGESCSAAVLSGHDVVYVARVAGARLVSVGLHVGTRLPAHCTSMGRVLLCELPDAKLAEFLNSATIEKKTDKTLTDPAALKSAIRKAAQDGFSIVDEELEIGLRSLAVPIRDLSGRIVAAINVSTQSARTSVDEMEQDFLPLLSQAAGRIEDYFVVQ
jgi:IclR family pca regulon transcriptional regulator